MPDKKSLFLFVILVILCIIKPSYSGEWSYYVRDHLGNTRVVLDETGNAKAVYDYHPFGLTSRSIVSGYDVRYKFTGKELDDEGGLDWYYFGARYYDPAIGRWLSVDPLAGRSPSLTPYHYVRNNPFIFFDPDGEKEFKVTFRTFIPYANVAGFRGDNRGKSTSEKASFRTSHSIRVETNPDISSNPLIKDEGGEISRTHTTYGGFSAQGKGKFTTDVTRTDANNGDNAVISVTGTATNPFDISGATSIDYDFQITLTPGENGVPNAKVTGSHDGFPAYEINVKNEAGETHQVYYNGVNGKWEVRKLLPPKDEKVEEEK